MFFVTLVKFVPGRAKEAFAELQRFTERFRGAYMYITFGRYDGLFVWEAPDLAAANRNIKALNESGLFTTETMLAQPMEDFVY